MKQNTKLMIRRIASCLAMTAFIILGNVTVKGQALHLLPEKTAPIDSFDYVTITRDSVGHYTTYKCHIQNGLFVPVIDTVIREVDTIISNNTLSIVDQPHGLTMVPTTFYRISDSNGSLIGPSNWLVLPSQPPDKTVIRVKLSHHFSSNITVIKCPGGERFNTSTGAQTDTLYVQGQSDLMQYRAFDSTWTIVHEVPYSAMLALISVTPTNVVTLTNKRITGRDSVATNYAGGGVTYNLDSYDGGTISALANALNFVNPGGTPTNKQWFNIAIKDNGTAQTLTWGTNWVGGTSNPLPTTTVISKILSLDFQYLTIDSKYHLQGVNQE